MQLYYDLLVIISSYLESQVTKAKRALCGPRATFIPLLPTSCSVLTLCLNYCFVEYLYMSHKQVASNFGDNTKGWVYFP